MNQVQVELSVPEAQISKIKTGYNIEVEVGNLPEKHSQEKFRNSVLQLENAVSL
ncbi:hypothetical protein [Paenibacillus sp. H1-7]|uniref:hypothetical protein n=1 Tax=Paenibacillus sp. H1-7 TaxID=2282849 RepID=UPI001EF9B565|nr:hypothetical protein [Paenibacillus sp. H1-7]